MVFLFLVTVIMLNLLIAQFTKRYEDISKTAIKAITPDRAKILVKLQWIPSWAEFFCVRQKLINEIIIMYMLFSKFLFVSL